MLDLNSVPQLGEPRAGGTHAAPCIGDAIVAFRQAASQRGVLLPPEIIADGEIHRCDTTGKHGDGDGSYILHLNGLPAGGFQNWQDGSGWQKWHADPGRELTPAELDDLRRKRDSDKAKRIAARDAAQANTAAKAAEIWQNADPNPDHRYLDHKRITAHGVRQQDRSNSLTVPMYDAAGTLQNLQLIDQDGAKRFLKHGRKDGCLFGIAGLRGGPALIAEGFSTAATLYQATGFNAIVAFDAGNLLAVAKIVRDQFPDGEILICADDDSRRDNNPGVTKAGEAANAIGAKLVVPQFGPERAEGDSDFNDVAKLYGEAEVKRQIGVARSAPAQEIEIVPPARSIADVEALVKTLDRGGMGSEPQRQTMTMALKGLATLNPGALTEEGILKQIASRTGSTLNVLKKTLAAIKRELGIKVTVTPEADVICARYVFVKQINAFLDRNSKTVCELKGVANFHRAEMPVDDETGKPMDPLQVMLDGALGMTCDRVDSIGFLPGEKEIFQEGESSVLNLWTKPDIVAVEGDVSPFLNHVEYILDGDGLIVNHVLDYLAHLVQKPAEKIKSTILIVGTPGTGKSAIGEMMSPLLGERNVTAIEDSDLKSSFNEWMDGVQLVLINELYSVNTRETKNRLKSYITDPWIRINRKKVSTYKYRNLVNFMMFSNHDDATPLDKGDRRYMMWKSKAKPREAKYYKDLWRWFNHGGAARLLHYLQNRELSEFDPNVAPPSTAAKEEAIADSRTPTESYLQDAFDNGEPPFRHDLVSIMDIIDWLREHKKMNVNHKELSLFLRSIDAVKLGQKGIKQRRSVVWAIRNAPEWEQVGDKDIKSGWRDIPEAALTDAERDGLLGRTG